MIVQYVDLNLLLLPSTVPALIIKILLIFKYDYKIENAVMWRVPRFVSERLMLLYSEWRQTIHEVTSVCEVICRLWIETQPRKFVGLLSIKHSVTSLDCPQQASLEISGTRWRVTGSPVNLSDQRVFVYKNIYTILCVEQLLRTVGISVRNMK